MKTRTLKEVKKIAEQELGGAVTLVETYTQYSAPYLKVAEFSKGRGKNKKFTTLWIHDPQ